ncbi:MAG TPA: glutamine synthetase family protein [Thermomicrobiales bacterium]|nr:glutamine synthetase family protein [Thermomicrobiales bacterium]
MVDELLIAHNDIDDPIDRLTLAGAQVVDLLFSDITGGIKSLTIPVSLLGDAMRQGYRFDGSALTGGDRRAELDLFLVPDAETLVLIPPGLFGEGSSTRGRLYCSVRRADGQPFPGDPRSALERMLVRAAAEGYDYRVGLEIEYYLVRTDGETIEQAITRRPTHRTSSAGGYFGVGEDLITATRDEIVATLQRLGVGVGGAHHETGPNQEELDLLPAGGIRMADQIMTVRQVIRSVANRYGFQATFMPKPFVDAAGSGMHLFQQVASYPDGGDALRDDDDTDDLSRIARYLIAGQLAHAPGMAAIVNPTVNSYKRLAAGHRAPRHVRWARVGQSSLIRVPNGIAGQPLQLELRSPDAMANPYLALAVAIGCGLDGIAHGEEPPYPLDESLVAYDDAELERMGTQKLPMSLGDALSALAEDEVIRDALGDYIFEQLLSVKRAEWDDYRQDVSPWEHARYL